MKKYSLSRFLLAGLLLSATVPLAAQTDSTRTERRSQRRSYEGNIRMNTWSVTLRGGPTQFFGDLREGDFRRGDAATQFTYALGGSVNKQLSHLWGIKLNVDVGNMSGSNRNFYNAYFTNNFIQSTFTTDVNLKSLVFGSQKLRRWKFDVFTGIGYIWFDSNVYAIASDFRFPGFTPDLLLGSSNIPETSPKTSGDWTDFGSEKTRDIVIPVGLSLEYQLSKRFDLGAMYTYNFVNSSKLDQTKPGVVFDHSASIFVFGDKGDGRRDRYGYAALTLSYKIGRNAAMVTKDGKYPAEAGRYHLKWVSPEELIPPVYNPTIDTALARVKAIMPKEVDPRLYTDGDGDSVADLFDKEPSTPPNSVVSGGGVAMDLNKYVKDILDQKKPNDTCLELFSNVEFRTDQATIPTASYQNLQNLVQYLNAQPDCRVVLVGHADRRESDAYNMRLSQRRSMSVKKYMIRAGLKDPSRVLIEYYGEFKPTAPSASADGLRANRRVEIKVRANNQWRDYPGN